MIVIGANDRSRKPFDDAEQVSRLQDQVDRALHDLDRRASHHPPVRLPLALGIHQIEALGGARNTTDGRSIESCQRDVEDLFSRAEDLLTFLENDQAALPPPLRSTDRELR
ncbi:hypothetical protein SAMN05216276_1003258 [Streptosporangium subroseum]|uniref:Uncharacterized protein n=1 Tax=Streptosporangium subroseum TaxID=106412 RepID=A0A239BIC2_9ACTN|nr:hypothetical protein [Streptosporangium subroseum]SNS07907.1 hypothetical protein SAMN05216276_1003258 [Streptosporangium subroseum]